MPWYQDVEDITEFNAFDAFLKQASGNRDLVASFDLRMAHLAGQELKTTAVFKGGYGTNRNQKVVETLFGPFAPGKPLAGLSRSLARIPADYMKEFKTLDTTNFAAVTEWVMKSHSIGTIEDEMATVWNTKVRATMDKAFASFRKAHSVLISKEKTSDKSNSAFTKKSVTLDTKSAAPALAKLRKHLKMKLDGQMLGLRGGHLKGRFLLIREAVDGNALMLVSSDPDKAIAPKMVTEALALQDIKSTDAVEGWFAQPKDKKSIVFALKAGTLAPDVLSTALIAHGCKARKVTIADKKEVLEAE